MATKRKSTLTELLQVRLSKKELQDLRKKARNHKTTVSKWCRYIFTSNIVANEKGYVVFQDE